MKNAQSPYPTLTYDLTTPTPGVEVRSIGIYQGWDGHQVYCVVALDESSSTYRGTEAAGWAVEPHMPGAQWLDYRELGRILIMGGMVYAILYDDGRARCWSPEEAARLLSVLS